MLSRVAESIYWMHRYLERAEGLARVVQVNLHLGLDAGEEQWAPLIQVLGDLAVFSEPHDQADRDEVIAYLAFDPSNPSSILSCLDNARANARAVRDTISSELWEKINHAWMVVKSGAVRGLASSDPFSFFEEVKSESHLVAGVADATMSHGEAWHFGRLGRLLERADMTTRVLDIKYFVLLPALTDVGTPLDDVQWSALLRSVSALDMYRRRHGRISPDSVADFLLLDREFPRSVLFCLVKAEDSLRAISGSAAGTFSSPAEQRLGRLRSRLGYARIDDVRGGGLHEFLDATQIEMNRIGDAISTTFFDVPLPASAVAAQTQ